MKILCFGSLNLDKVYSVSHFLRAGETLSSTKMQEYCGGKGLNQSVALARAGAETYHAGCIGQADGGPLLAMLNASGVNTSLVKALPCPSGHAIIQVNEQGQNCILLYGGANQEVSKQQIDATLEQFQAGDMLVLQNEISNLSYLIETAGKKGMEIVLNPSPMNEAILNLPLQYVRYFILNEVEARDLCAEEGPENEFADKLLLKFPNSKIVLTLGSKGSIYVDSEQRIVQPAYRVDTVDTTAAGDTFTGYFLAGIAAKMDVKLALQQAAKAAAIAVSRKGAAPSIPTLEETQAFR